MVCSQMERTERLGVNKGMRDENYLVIQGFMRTQLNLKGNELLIYALIYGFCQDGGEFTGSIGYITEWVGSTKKTIITTIKSLIDKGLLTKEEEVKNGVKFCKYRAVYPQENTEKEGEEKITPPVKKLHRGGVKITPNNLIDNIGVKEERISNDILSKKETATAVVRAYNEICHSLPKVTKLTDTRIRHINARLKEYTEEDLRTAFLIAEASDFLTGRTDRSKWKADFDWLMKESNLVKVLEGNYTNPDKKKDRFKEAEDKLLQDEEISQEDIDLWKTI